MENQITGKNFGNTLKNSPVLYVQVTLVIKRRYLI